MTAKKLALALLGVCVCGMSACGVTDIPKGPYQAEIKLAGQPEVYRYHMEKLNDFTFAIVNQQTGQAWECNVHDSKCGQVMFPTINPKTGYYTNFQSVPDESTAVNESK